MIAAARKTWRLADLDLCDIGDPNNQTAAIDDRRLSQILNRRGQGVGANHQGLACPLDIAGPGLGIGPLQRLDQIGHA